MPGVVLEISASPARPALAASRGMAEVRQAGLFGPVLHLVVPAPEVQPLIVERLRRAGIAVHQARVVEPSIEDVFVALLSGRP
jgi:ABC-2 type transport system ATP-binding protein